MAPTIKPMKTFGLRTLTIEMPARLTNAPNRASDTSAADPIANPFPIAAVVFPAASRASVLSRIQ